MSTRLTDKVEPRPRNHLGTAVSPPARPALPTHYVARCVSGRTAAMSATFESVNTAALAALPALVERWLTTGRRDGREYVALNPTRPDRRLGSFRINLTTGRWADFATGDRGGDPVSLAAYLFGLSQGEAASRLSDMLGLR